MKIERVETIHLCYHYSEGFTYAGGKCTARLTSLVLLHTECGKVGIGTAYSHPGMIELIVQQQLRPFLIGTDPTEVEKLWQLHYQLTRWYGRKGAAMTAIGAVDTALWDLRGQAAGKPLWELLGATRPTCPAYASALLWKAPIELAAEAEALIAQGFRRVKMRLGRSSEFDSEAVCAVRQAIGHECDVLVDGSMRYSPTAARRLAKVLRENNVFWFEEPFQPEELDAYVALRSEIDVPLAAGENEFGAQGFAELIDRGAVDIVQPDASRCGGISEVVKVGKHASRAGLQVATHSWSDAVAIVANAHAVAAMDNGVTVEIDRTENPLVNDLLVEPLRVSDGRLSLPERPGLGIELNMAVVEAYRLDDPMTLADGAYSDMVFGKDYYHPAPPHR